MCAINKDKTAKVDGILRHGENTYLAQGTIIRSVDDSVKIGDATMVLENTVVIGTPNNPVTVGSKTVFGHKCIAIGSTIGDLCEIGNCTVFLPGSKIGDMCIFGEGTIIGENQVIPERSVVVGRPGRVIRKLTDDDIAMIKRMRGNDISLKDFEYSIYEGDVIKGESMGKNIFEFGGKYPVIDETAIIYDTAEITGDVIIGENSVIASGVRIIGNSHGPVIIGKNVKIMENSVLHLLPDNKLILHDNVTIGPGCMIHGTEINEGTVVSAGAIVCDYSIVGKNVLIKEGALVKQRQVVEDNAIIEGFPGKETGKNEDPLPHPDWAIRK